MSAVPKQPAQADGITDLPSVDLSATITVSKAGGKKSQDWKKVTTSLGALLTNLKDIQVGKKGDGNAWTPATFRFERRLACYALETHLLVLDSDAGTSLAKLRARFEALGLYAVIIPSSSWGRDDTEASEDHYSAWVADQVEANPQVDPKTLPERFLIERHNKTPVVAKSASIIDHYSKIVTSASGTSSSISRPTVPWPAMTIGSSYG